MFDRTADVITSMDQAERLRTRRTREHDAMIGPHGIVLRVTFWVLALTGTAILAYAVFMPVTNESYSGYSSTPNDRLEARRNTYLLAGSVMILGATIAGAARGLMWSICRTARATEVVSPESVSRHTGPPRRHDTPTT